MYSLTDYLIAIPIIITEWGASLIWDRCNKSPDKRHYTVVQNGKVECKYCGKPPYRIAPGADGKDT